MLLANFKLGSGTRPTVLLHGFLGSGRNLRTLAQRWSERDPSRVFLLPDLRGHGASGPATEDTDLAAMGRDVLETAAAEGLTGPLDLVGHSLGGRVALAAARADLHSVKAVTLLDISPSPLRKAVSESAEVLKVLVKAPDHTPDRRAMQTWLTEHGLSPALASWLLMNVKAAEGGGFEWTFDRAGLQALHDRVLGEDLWEVLGGAVPVRCISGGISPYVPPDEVARLRQAGCPVTVLPGAGHYVHVDALEALLDALAAGN